MHPRSSTLAAIILLVGSRSLCFSQETAPEGKISERAVESAYLREDRASLEEDLIACEETLSANPHNPELLYNAGFASYASTAPLRAKDDKDAILTRLNKAGEFLSRVHGEPWEAEAIGLHGAILAQTISLKGVMSGMTLGPESNRLLSEAGKLLPASPRILLFRGISLYNTPAMFGGDRTGAMKLFRDAAAQFASERASAASGPRWGEADVLLWLGYAEKNLGDTASAKSTWLQVIAFEPEDKRVKFALRNLIAQKGVK